MIFDGGLSIAAHFHDIDHVEYGCMQDGYRFCEAGQPVFMGGYLEAAVAGGNGVVGVGVYEVK